MTTCSILEYLGIGANYFVSQILTVLLTSWPFIVLVIFIVLNNPLRRFLNRCAKELQLKDNKVTMGTPQASDTPSVQKLGGELAADIEKQIKNKRNKYPVPELENPDLKPYVSEIEKKLREDLKKSPYKDIDILIRDDALFRIWTECEKIYRTIFGSQMRFLRYLASATYAKASESEKFFKQEMSKIDDNKISFNDWVGYMSAMGLMEIENKKYKITDKGKAFLSYIAISHYEDRLG